MANLEQVELYTSTIKKVIEKQIPSKETSMKLEITDWQIRRLVVKYKKYGKNAFVHQNSGKPSHNKKISS